MTVPYEIFAGDQAKLGKYLDIISKNGGHVTLCLGDKDWSWDSESQDFTLRTNKDFAKPEDRPWHALRDKIKRVYLEAAPGKNAFNGCTELIGVSPLYSIRNSFIINSIDYKYSIGERAFYGCSKLVEVNANVQNYKRSYYPEVIGKEAFYACKKLREIKLDNATYIGDLAFAGCGFGSYRITMNKVEKIGYQAFSNCIDHPTYNTLCLHMYCRRPETSEDAFANNEHIKLWIDAKYADEYNSHPYTYTPFEIIKEVEFPITGSGWTISNEGTLKISSIGSSLLYFKKAEDAPWHVYRDYVKDIIVDGGTSLGDYSFVGMENVRNVILPRSCTSIGKCAFKDCSSLENISIYKVENIGSQAFEGCSSLKEVELGTNITSMGDYVFRGCVSLNEIENMTVAPGTATNRTFADIGSAAYSAPGGPRKAGKTAKDVLLTVPEESITKYMISQGWRDLANPYEDEHGTILGSGRYYDGYWVIFTDGTLIASSDTKEGEVDFFTPRDTERRREAHRVPRQLRCAWHLHLPQLPQLGGSRAHRTRQENRF